MYMYIYPSLPFYLFLSQFCPVHIRANTYVYNRHADVQIFIYIYIHMYSIYPGCVCDMRVVCVSIYLSAGVCVCVCVCVRMCFYVFFGMLMACDP